MDFLIVHNFERKLMLNTENLQSRKKKREEEQKEEKEKKKK